jgi:hypothetical protein
MMLKRVSRLPNRRDGVANAGVVRLAPILRRGRAVASQATLRWRLACRGALGS